MVRMRDDASVSTLASHTNGWTPSLRGWLRAEELERGRRTEGGLPIVFVAMSFHADWRPAFDDGIAPATRACGYEPLRVDIEQHNELIDDRIEAGLRSCQFVVADVSVPRGGIYYEAGVGYGLGKTVIYTVRSDCKKDVHFDIDHRNRIEWTTPADLRARLEQRILATEGPAAKRAAFV